MKYHFKLYRNMLIKKSLKYINHVKQVLSSAETSIFSPEMGKFCYIKKER